MHGVHRPARLLTDQEGRSCSTCATRENRWWSARAMHDLATGMVLLAVRSGLDAERQARAIELAGVMLELNKEDG